MHNLISSYPRLAHRPHVEDQGSVNRSYTGEGPAPDSSQTAGDSVSSALLHPDGESFSACLLVMDENPRLPEWLAYHYFALPLRYLVVAVDPNSATSPKEILDRWKGRMVIHQWTDSDFTEKDLKRQHHADATTQAREDLTQYLTRQEDFMEGCARFLKKENRTWTAFHDTDEFIAPNTEVLGNSTSDQLAAQPGYVMTALQQMQSSSPIQILPKEWSETFRRSHCVSLPRRMYSAMESTDDEVAKDVPSIINPRHFETLRWRYRTSKPLGDYDRVKSVIDVSKLGPHDFDVKNPHIPLNKLCRDSAWMQYGELPFGFHHYIGSWELYNHRQQDARQGHMRNYADWESFAKVNRGGPSDEGRPWIQGFVDLVGESDAIRLLAGAGLLPNPENNTIPRSSNTNASVIEG